MSFVLTINGQEKEFAQRPGSLSALLSELKINEATVVAEVNGQIVERKDFSTTRFEEGARIELVRFVGGG
ncbi:MAG: sulfur carrier protein ThiS [Planctomycetaceae bacterium]|nr:sulfur carrier protein ThiS [Planctomycetaceae bacterium]